MKNIIYKILVLVLIGCGGGTTTGNPIRLTLQSASYKAPLLETASTLRSEKANTLSSLDFSLCVTDVLFENSLDERIEVAFDDIGLVDLSDSSITKTWGELLVNKNASFEFDTIVIVSQVDEKLCGVDYSMRFQGNEITTEFELIFEYTLQKFNADDGDFYRLDVEKIVDAADEALVDGEFNDDDWTDYIDDFIGDFEEDDDIEDDEGEFGD